MQQMLDWEAAGYEYIDRMSQQQPEQPQQQPEEPQQPQQKRPRPLPGPPPPPPPAGTPPKSALQALVFWNHLKQVAKKIGTDIFKSETAKKLTIAF